MVGTLKNHLTFVVGTEKHHRKSNGLLIKPADQDPHCFSSMVRPYKYQYCNQIAQMDLLEIRSYRPLVKGAYQKIIFLFLSQNIYCGYSKEHSQ